jgi:hypothetical protein
VEVNEVKGWFYFVHGMVGSLLPDSQFSQSPSALCSIVLQGIRGVLIAVF